MWRVGGVEKNHACSGGKGTLIRERERERTVCRGLHKKNTSPKLLIGKMRGADYCKLLKAAELKD